MKHNNTLLEFEPARVEAYLTQRLGQDVHILSMEALGGPTYPSTDEGRKLKHYGYGQPILIRYRVDAAQRCVVLRTMTANPFGHEHRAEADQQQGEPCPRAPTMPLMQPQ